ncbi:MAG: hypothetical protein ABFR19_01335 [Pseudomonadota bacterium]
MSISKSLRKSSFIAGVVLLLALSGCYDPYYVGAGVGYQTPYYGSTVVTYEQPLLDYYYYPSVGVYYNYRSGYYYHHDHGRWRHVRRLPRNIHIHDDDRVHLRIRGDRPYLYHDEHRHKYKGYRKYDKQYRKHDKKHVKRYKKYDKGESRKYKKHSKKYDKRQKRQVKSDYSDLKKLGNNDDLDYPFLRADYSRR